MPGSTSRATSSAADRPRQRIGAGAVLLFVLCALPLLQLAWRHAQGTLGADPLHALIHGSGWWAMTWLLATLSVTPLRRASVWVTRQAALRYGRRWSDWNHLIRLRRQLGLWSFAYALVHGTLYAVLDAGSLAEVLTDAADRPFVAIGVLALLLLVPLAATSTQASIRRLRRHWIRLHRLVYPVAALVLVHAWMQTKVGHALPLEHAAWAAVLLMARIGWHTLPKQVASGSEAKPAMSGPVRGNTPATPTGWRAERRAPAGLTPPSGSSPGTGRPGGSAAGR